MLSAEEVGLTKHWTIPAFFSPERLSDFVVFHSPTLTHLRSCRVKSVQNRFQQRWKLEMPQPERAQGKHQNSADRKLQHLPCHPGLWQVQDPAHPTLQHIPNTHLPPGTPPPQEHQEHLNTLWGLKLPILPCELENRIQWQLSEQKHMKFLRHGYTAFLSSYPIYILIDKVSGHS